jgi:pyruvate carboxylase
VGKLFVTEGQEVSAGDPLLTIISMKMENTLFAREDGVIKAVLVKEKEIVEAAALLISFAGTDEEKGN